MTIGKSHWDKKFNWIIKKSNGRLLCTGEGYGTYEDTSPCKDYEKHGYGSSACENCEQAVRKGKDGKEEKYELPAGT